MSQMFKVAILSLDRQLLISFFEVLYWNHKSSFMNSMITFDKNWTAEESEDSIRSFLRSLQDDQLAKLHININDKQISFVHMSIEGILRATHPLLLIVLINCAQDQQRNISTVCRILSEWGKIDTIVAYNNSSYRPQDVDKQQQNLNHFISSLITNGAIIQRKQRQSILHCNMQAKDIDQLMKAIQLRFSCLFDESQVMKQIHQKPSQTLYHQIDQINFIEEIEPICIGQQNSNHHQIINSKRSNAYDTARRKVQQIVRKYSSRNKDECISSVFQKDFEEASHTLNKTVRAQFKREIQQCEQLWLYWQILQKGDNQNKQQNTQTRAISTIKNILQKYNASDSTQCLEDIFKKQYVQASYKVKKHLRQAFLKQIKECPQLNDYWQSLQLVKRNQAQIAIRSILEQFNITNQYHEECLKEILGREQQQASYKVKKDKRKLFIERINNCPKIKAYLQQLSSNTNDAVPSSEPIVKLQATLSLQELTKAQVSSIIEKYNPIHPDECLSDVLSKNFESAASYIKRQKRNEFISQIRASQTLQQFWLKNTVPSDSLQEVSKEILNIIMKFNIQDKDQCLNCILENQIQAASQFVIPRKKQDFLIQLSSCKIISDYIKGRKDEGQRFLLNIQNNLKVICQSLDIGQVQQCVKDLLEGNIQDAVLSVTKSKRQQFRDAINSYTEYKQYISTHPLDKDEKFRKAAEQHLKSIIVEFKVVEVAECLQCIMSGDIEKAKMNVKSIFRQTFVKKCRESKEYIKYQESKKSSEKQSLKRIAENALRFILMKYVVDVEDCLNLLINQGVSVMITQVKKEKRALFSKDIQDCSQYQNFIFNNEQVKVQKSQSYQQSKDSQSISNFMEKLATKSVQSLKQTLGLKIFYQNLQEIQKDENFRSFFVKNQMKFYKQVSYFYYFIEDLKSMDECLAILEINSSQNNKLKSKKWIIEFSEGDNHERKQLITGQIQLLNEITNSIHSQKAALLSLILEQYLKIISIKWYCETRSILSDRFSQKQNPYQSINFDTLNNPANLHISDSYVKRKKSQLNMSVKFLLDIFKVSKIEELINYFLVKSEQNEYKVNNFQENIHFQKVQVGYGGNKKKQLQYLQNKKLAFEVNLIKLFNMSFAEQINHQLITINLDKQSFKMYFSVGISIDKLFKMISKKKQRKITFQQYFIQTVYGNQKKGRSLQLQSSSTIAVKPQSISLFKKCDLMMIIRNQPIKFIGSKEMPIGELKAIVIRRLIQVKKIQLQNQNLQLQGKIDIKTQMITINESIENLQLKHSGSFKFIKIIIRVNVFVYFESKRQTFSLQSNKTVDDLKMVIEKKLAIPPKFQILSLGEQQKQKQIQNGTIQSLSKDYTTLALKLTYKANLSFYGFYQNYPMTFVEFSKFFIDKNNQIQQLIDNCSLKKQNENIFFNQLIRLIFSTIKRRFPFSYIINQVRQGIFNKNSQQIWSSSDFNDYFLLYYILYNSQRDLRIEIINIVKQLLPIPLYFRKFRSINQTQNQFVLNNEISWFLQPSFTITCIGFHNAQRIKQEKGKTFLNNQILFTNFQSSEEKHQICQGCPEISLKVLRDIKEINIIDIPASTPSTILKQIIKNSNMLIINSWRDSRQTESYVKELKKSNGIKKIISFLRDRTTRQQTITKIKDLNLDDQQMLELYNLQENSVRKKQLPFINILRDKIWSFIKNAYNQWQQKKSIKLNYKFFDNQLQANFDKQMAKIKDKFLQLNVVFKKYEKLKELKRQNSKYSSDDKIEELKKEIIDTGIALPFRSLISFINKNKDSADLLLLRFRQNLKHLKNQYERRYLILNKYKKKLVLASKNDEKTYKQLISKVIKEIKKLPLMGQITIKNDSSSIIEEISTAFQYYQNNIKPNLFTIQSAWRELQYLSSLKEDIQIDNTYVNQILVSLKRKELQKYQPFQIIDGDLLQMPRNTIKRIFQGVRDRVAVITILGPQSSGKSTLLNFLFGCDFGTSQGRCTRGVYGTYFNFSNLYMSHCQGVFLIDTQGLFANVNKKDSSRRKDFDSKLVLFCLAVSDYVLINTKGNLDSQSTRILQSSLDRFSALSEQNLKCPEILLILNQNNSANLINSEADINKLRQIFGCQNSVSLNQAYKLTELTSKDINMLPEDENLVIKKPRPEFLTLTNELQSLIMNKIESKTSFQPISEVIDSMEKIWSTIETFPDLGKNVSKKIQQVQKQISKWHIQKTEILMKEGENLFQKFNQNISYKKQTQQKFMDLISAIKAQFQSIFLCQKQMDKLADDEKVRVQLQGKKLELSYESFKFQFHSRIQDHEKSLLAEKSKSEGSQHIKEAIRQVKKIQRDERIKLPKEQKIAYFENAFNKSLQRIKSASGSDQLLQSYFERVHEYYKNAMSISATMNRSSDNRNGTNAGLPKAVWGLESNPTFDQYSKSLFAKIIHLTGNESNKIIEFRNSPPTRILEQTSKTDAKLNYFNMRQYFDKVPVEYNFEISQQNLCKSIRINNLLQKAEKQFQKSRQEDKKINQIFQQLNQCFTRFGFKMKFLNHFLALVKYQFSKIFNLALWSSNKPKIVLEFFPKQKYQNILFQNFLSNSITIVQQQYSGQIKKQFSNRLSELMNQMEIQEESFANSTINKYLNYQSFTLLIQYISEDKSKLNNHGVRQFITQQFQQIFNFKQIKKYIDNTLSSKNLENQKHNYILQILKKNINSGFQYLKQTLEQLTKKDKSSNQKAAQDIIQNLISLTHLDYSLIKKQYSKNKAINKKQNYYCIGCFKQESFQVKQQYRLTKNLQIYMNNDVASTTRILRTEQMKNFVFGELMNKGSFYKLFENAERIVFNSPQSFTNQSVKNIYIDVNKEIVEFNNDLNQVCYKLTLIFTGYLHLFTIYMIWKKNSQFALRVANKPYNDFMQAKQKQLSFFMSQTSSNQQKKSKGQVARFMDSILTYFKKIASQHKHKINRQQGIRFKEENKRQKIQDKLDHQCFSVTSSPQDWINYLENPASIIQDQYHRLIEHYSFQLQYKYSSCEQLEDLFKQLKDFFAKICQKFNSQGLNEDSIHTDIMGIKNKTKKQISVADSEVNEQIRQQMMNYLLDLLSNSEKQFYQLDDFTLEIKIQWKKSKIARQSSRHFQPFVRALRSQKLSITKFHYFINSVNKKLNDIQPYQQKQKKKNPTIFFSSIIKKFLTRNDEDYNDFRELVEVKICREQCPGCQRICGVEESHTNNHQCKYGHQMRALGGVKLSNGDASVIRCEDVPLMSQIQFNGKKMTWKQFKYYWQSKPEGSWNFQDLKDHSKKQLFIKAWDIAGPIICDKHQIKFVKSNALDTQKSVLYGGPVHLIFAIDKSGSMSGQKWLDLKKAFLNTINTIQKMALSEQNFTISILLFTDICQPYLQGVSPSKIILNFPQPFGGTNFSPVFKKAHQISKKYISSHLIKFIFMTDGEAQFPFAQIQQLRSLRQKYPNKFEYSGIQFQSTSKVMKQIEERLQGTNFISYSSKELTSAYLQIINRKIQ